MRVWPKLTRLLLLSCVSMAITSANAALADDANKPADTLAEIRSGSEAFVKAFNEADAKAVAALWTQQGEYVDDAGQVFSGREAIEKEYAKFFAEHKGASINLTIDSLRLVGDSIAIEEGRAEVEPSSGVPGYTLYTVVHSKVDGKWLMASVRDRFVAKPSNYEGLADLEWLIGTWVAEERGAKMESVCRWVADKSFVERTYTTTMHDGTKTSGVQLIGWNPVTKSVQSWNFSPDGGHAVGLWVPIDSGWRANMRGMTGDGTITTSINVMTRLDDNAYSWQSVDRTAGDVALPDSDEVVVKRQK
ncbi:YybH family protein [Bremerella cremea]|nr:SgcJ/EcaC family oxidoreductase [Bremerella cremea]